MADGISRRDFLGGLAATVGAASATPLLAADPQAIPRKPKPGEPPSSSGGSGSGKAVLTQNDFKYAGLFTLPAGAQLGFSNGALTGRRVGGELHLLVCGG